MNEQNRIAEMDVNESMAALMSFYDNIKINISIFIREFTQAYESFTKKASESSTDQSMRVRRDDQKHGIVKDLYDYFMNLLSNFKNSFAQEYTETLSMAIEISTLKASYNDIFMRYSNFDDLDIDHLDRLEKKVRRIINRHNKLALKFNARIRHFEALRKNILNGSLVYTSKNKRFAVSVSDKLIRFQQIIASDVKFRRAVNIGSLRQFPQAMEDTASKFQFAEISPLGESNLKFLPRETPKRRKRKPEDSDSDRSRSSSDVPEERTKIRRGARRTKGFAKVKPLDARKKEVEEIPKTIVPVECQDLLDITLKSLEAILPYKIKKFKGFIEILKDDQGVTQTSTIVEDILQTPNVKFPPTKIYGLSNPDNFINPSIKIDPPPKRKKRAEEYALVKKYDRLKAENDVKIMILKDGIAEMEAFGKSVNLLYLLDDSYNLEDCNEFMGTLCQYLLTKFEEARNNLPGVLKKIRINDIPPLGEIKDYHNRSSEAKLLLVEQEQLECQMRNSFSLYDNAIKKLNSSSSISNEEIQKMKDRITEFVETCVQNITDKIQDLKREIKVLDAQIQLIDKEKKQAGERRKKRVLEKLAAESAAAAAAAADDDADDDDDAAGDVAGAATSSDAAGATTSGDDDVIMADDTTTAAGSSVNQPSSFVSGRNPTRTSREHQSARLNADLAPSSQTYTPEFLEKVVDELKIKILNPARDQIKKRKLRSRIVYHKSLGDCRNIFLIYQSFNDDFEEFLKDWKDKIKIDSMDICDKNQVSEVKKKLKDIEKSGKLVAKSSVIPLSSIVEKQFDDNEELVKLKIEYLSLALILVYLQVQYYDYKREKVIQSTNNDTEVDKFTADIEHANKCFQAIVINREKLIPE